MNVYTGIYGLIYNSLTPSNELAKIDGIEQRVNDAEDIVQSTDGSEIQVVKDADVVDEENIIAASMALQFPCSLCEKSFKLKTSLRRHLKLSHLCVLEDISPGKKFKCNLCSKSYDKLQNPTRHSKKKNIMFCPKSMLNKIIVSK